MRQHPTILVPPCPGEPGASPLLQVADHAIGLWRAAEDLGDLALLESLRPLLTYIARVLARDVMDADEDVVPQ